MTTNSSGSGPDRRSSSRWTRGLAGAATALALSAGPALAQGTPAASSPWSFSITPYLWVSGIGGTVQSIDRAVPAQSISASFGDVMSHLNGMPFMGAAEARYDRFGLAMDLMYVSARSSFDTRTALHAGGSARVSQVIGSGLLTYRAYQSVEQNLDLGVGFRAFGLGGKLTLNPGLAPGRERSPSQSWANPIFAVRYHARLAEAWGATLYGDVGGTGSGNFTWQLFGTIDYSLTESITLRAGYRHLQFQFNGDRVRQNMSMSGPIIGATFRF